MKKKIKTKEDKRKKEVQAMSYEFLNPGKNWYKDYLPKKCVIIRKAGLGNGNPKVS